MYQYLFFFFFFSSDVLPVGKDWRGDRITCNQGRSPELR